MGLVLFLWIYAIPSFITWLVLSDWVADFIDDVEQRIRQWVFNFVGEAVILHQILDEMEEHNDNARKY